MKRQNYLKSMLCLLLGLVCHVAWAQSTAIIEVSTSVNSPENMYEIKSSAGHWMTSYTSPSGTVRGCFAFFDDNDENTENAYKIYSVTHNKWVSYTKAASYSDGSNKATLVDNQADANAWNATIVTVSDVEYYQFAPYNTTGVASKYWNWHGGTSSNPYNNVEKTVGFYSTGASGDGGSRWLLSKVTELAAAEAIAEAQTIVAEKVGYPRANAGVSVLFNHMLQSGVASSTSLSNMVSAYKTSSDILLPEDGKAYTMTSVMGEAADATKYYMKYVNGQKVSVSKTESDASVFVCKELRTGVYAFITSDGHILTWVGNDEGGAYKENNNIYGYSSNYATEYDGKSDWNEITVKKNNTAEKDFGYLRLVGRRNTGTTSSFIANANNRFDQAGDGYWFNATNSSAWIITEVEHTNTDAQTLALAKIDAKVAVAGNAAKLGAGIGYAHYVVNGEEVYDVTAINAGIDAATTVDAVNAIKNSYAVNLPEFGKAYTMTLVANDANKTQYKMIANDATLTASTEGESCVFYCLQSSSNDFPYIFVSEDGYVLAYHTLTETYTAIFNNFKVEGMVEKSSNYITSTVADRLGTVCITTDKRIATPNKEDDGCVIFNYTANSATAWDNSAAPYHNGTYTSAIIMTEVENYTCTDAQIAKADDILGRTALKTQVEELRDQLKHQPGYYCCTINGVKYYDADAIIAVINAASSAAAVAEITAAINAKTSVLPEFGKAYKMAFKTKAGALHHIVADDATLALSASTDEADASVFYCMQSSSADYPYIFVSAEGGFLTFKALSDAYISRVTDFKVGGMADMSSSNITSTVDARIGTVYIATNKRPGSTYDDDGCFVFKNQNNTYDGADVPFHNDNFTSAIVMTEVEAESKTIYEVVVDGDANAIANAYVAYDNGTVVRKAFNDGFFVTNGATITEEQLSAGFVGNCVKSATISMEGRVITLSDVEIYPTPVKTDLYNTSNGSLEVPPYRIPGITVDPETGRIITAAAELVCGTDPGYGEVDIVCRISDNNGDTWTDMIKVADGTGEVSAERNIFETAFGDPAIVADRTSNEVLVIAVAGCTVYGNVNTTRQNPNMIATIHSTDNGDTWGTPVDVTEPIYSLFDSGNPIQAAFVGGGKIFQSRIVKVGQYYRLYAAMCARDNGNRVIYSDDFGRTWHALGGASALPAPGGDEPKCEEMPDGRVILSSRVGGGRIYNIYTYSNTATAEGSWDTAVTSTFEGSGKAHNGQSTNGEILIVPVVRNSDQKDMYLTLQSLPAGSGRSHVGIFYKELTDMTDINTVANFAIDWNGYFEVTDKTSAYSSMDLQNDDRIGFIYEETLTSFGRVDNPVSTCFPTGEGQHSYDGYDNIYVAYPLEIITNGAYSIKREVDRREFLQTYFTDLTADAADEVKAAVATDLEDLSTEPTIDEIDNIYFNIGKGTVITDLDANAGKIGGFTDAVIADYKAAVKAATTAAELAAAKATALASAEWNMPVSGKAYTFKNVQKDGTTVRWYKYDATNNNIVLTATESEATPFVCSLLENGKYVFVCSDGKYMTWRADASGHTTSGVLDAYDMTANKYYTDITIAKMTTGGSIANGVDLSTTCYVSISASRDDRDEIGYVVVKKNGGNPTFDGAGDAYYNDNFSSAFIMEEVEVPFGNAPKVNSVGESGLVSDDLKNAHMSTFSATYATVAPEGVTAYYATKSGENVVLNAIAQGEAIPANTGVILVAEEGGNAVMLPASGETAADVTGNLMGHSAGAAKDMSSVANAYILTGGAQGTGFYRCTSGTLAANKAYLVLPQQAGANAPAIRIRLADAQGGTPTGIDNSQCTIDNGQLTIYDLQGRRVLNPTKGMYIVNGKKVLF